MKSRDAAIVVDHHRRQGMTAPSPSKGDEQARKKKAPPPPPKQTSNQKQPNKQQSQGPAIATGALVAQPQAMTKKATTSTAATSTKKNAGKQQTKATKKEKEKQNAKNGSTKDVTSATSASTTTAATTSASASSTTSKQQRTSEQTLDPDSLKSRNHTLFLAPSGSSACSSKLLPSWGRSRKESATHSVTERLHTEILEYAQYTRSTVEDMAVHIELMITNVRTCVQSLWPHSNVETFGSYSTGIWLPSSDVDLVILDVVEVSDAVITVKNLRRLAKALEAQAWVHSLVLLDTAKIPVLKLVSADTRVPIDITFESSSTHSGLIARDLIKRYADELPELYPLAVVFKQLLRERDLNDAYTGGLSSYSIVLMIIHFAQLWRNGEKCFLAASIYASGSLPPSPAALAAEAARLAALDTKTSGSPMKASSDSTGQVSKSGKTSTPTEVGSPVKAAPLAPTSSYAAIVSRPKSLKRSVSETGGKNSGDSNSNSSNGSSESQPVQRFSYAAVAAGIVKVSEDDSSRSKKTAPAAAPAPPSSYAAAVAAAGGSKSSTAASRSSSATKVSATGGSASGTSSSTSGNPDTQLDSASVTSSNADTEDSSSSCSSSSAADSDDESSRQQQQQPVQRCVCLGEHTMMLLEFFGIIFDYRKNGISIRDGGYIYRLADHGSEIGKPALVIEDPIHPDRNVSASSFAFSKVVAVFEDSFYALKYHRPSKFAPSALSCLLSASGHTSHTTKGTISR